MAICAALVGRSGSGTSTMARRAASLLDWPYASFGAYVRSQAAALGMQGTRLELQDLGLHLLSDVNSFCRAVLAQSLWRPGQNLIVDGVRHQAVLDSLQSLLGDVKICTINVEATPVFREAHLRQRGEGLISELATIDSHEVEKELLHSLPQVAQRTIAVTCVPCGEPILSEEFQTDVFVELLLELSNSPKDQSKITREFTLRIPRSVREMLQLKAGDLVQFSESAPCIVAARVVDEERMRSVFGRLNQELKGIDPNQWIRQQRQGLDAQ